MEYTYYNMTVPVYMRSLKTLKGVLAKGELYVKEKGLNETTFLDSKLAPDMFPLVKQVQMTCDNAKGSSARLAGLMPPVMEDTEKTFGELYARIDKTIAYLETFTPEQFVNAAEQKVTLPYFKDKHFIGREFAVEYALPNYFFHVVTAYNILRNQGVVVGKSDFIGGFTSHDN